MSDVDVPTEISARQIGPVGLYAFSFVDAPYKGLVVSIIEHTDSSVIAEIFGVSAPSTNIYLYENGSIVKREVVSEIQEVINFVDDVLRGVIGGLDSYQVELNHNAIPSHIDYNVVEN